MPLLLEAFAAEKVLVADDYRGGTECGMARGHVPTRSHPWRRVIREKRRCRTPLIQWVGLRFTGKPCHAIVRFDDSGAARVESSFVPGRAVSLTPVAETFYLGELGGGSALVVQFDGDGALLDLTYTSYDEAGDLNYGVSGAGTFFKECVKIERLE